MHAGLNACSPSSTLSCGSGTRRRFGRSGYGSRDGPAGCTADSEVDAQRRLSADLGTELGESRSAATAVASAPHGAGAHAPHEPTASRGAQPGLRCKKRLWREAGRQQLEGFRLALWASRRRQDLLELLDRLNPTIAELTKAIEREVEKCPQARRLQTHPGVGPLTALAFMLILGQADRFRCGKQIAS